MSKRAIFSYLFTLSVIIFCFSAVYYFDYSRMKEAQEQKALQAAELEESRDIYSTKPDDESYANQAASERYPDFETVDTAGKTADSEIEETSDGENLAAEAAKSLRTSSSMLYVVGQYDWTTGIVTETVEKFPEELLGLTRQELLVFLHDHPENGTLLSFSEHAVFLRKNDNTDWSEYSYYLILEEDGLMVYYFDQTTLYLNTGISGDELSRDNRELLEEGFYIKDTASLFDYLQTVTS